MVYQLTIIQILCSILLYVEDEVLFVQPSINKASNIRQNEYFVRIGFLITLVLFNQKELLSLQIRIVDLIFATLLLNCLKVVKYFFNVFKHTHTYHIASNGRKVFSAFSPLSAFHNKVFRFAHFLLCQIISLLLCLQNCFLTKLERESSIEKIKILQCYALGLCYTIIKCSQKSFLIFEPQFFEF